MNWPARLSVTGNVTQSVVDVCPEVLAACIRIDVKVGNCGYAVVEVGVALQAVVLPNLGVDACGEVERGVAASEGSFFDPSDDLPALVF